MQFHGPESPVLPFTWDADVRRRWEPWVKKMAPITLKSLAEAFGRVVGVPALGHHATQLNLLRDMGPGDTSLCQEHSMHVWHLPREEDCRHSSTQSKGLWDLGSGIWVQWVPVELVPCTELLLAWCSHCPIRVMKCNLYCMREEAGECPGSRQVVQLLQRITVPNGVDRMVSIPTCVNRWTEGQKDSLTCCILP